MKKKKLYVSDFLLIIIGTSIYSFGFVHFNLANHLAEGGIAGITLILKALFQIDPAYSYIVLNIPLFLLSGFVLGKKQIGNAIFGTALSSFWIWIWQRVHLEINIDKDLFIASLLAGIFSGIGAGLVYRAGGIAGGADIIARIMEIKRGISMGKSLLALDTCVLLSSLLYIDLSHMLYTLIASFIFSRLVEFVQNGGYTARGVLIISNKSEEIATNIMNTLARGVTFLNGKGGYSHDKKQVIYIVLSPSEINTLKHMVAQIDNTAFVSIINVQEIIGEGFTYEKKIN